MPSLRELGDSDAVENKYTDRFVFYVEGEDDKNLLAFVLLGKYASEIEVKVPSTLGSGYRMVIERVTNERTVNGKVFGIVDGEALLVLGHLCAYKKKFGREEWISVEDCDGIFFTPCWELENLLVVRDVLAETVRSLQPVRNLAAFNEKRIRNMVIREAFRLSEWSCFNLALLSENDDLLRGETVTDIDSRRELVERIVTVIENRKNAHQMAETFDGWRAFFRRLLRGAHRRDDMYDAFVSRIDGKALLVRLRRKLNIGIDMRSALASSLAANRRGRRLFDRLLEAVQQR